MRLVQRKMTPRQWQFLIWGFVILINFLGYLPMDGFNQAVVFSPLGAAFYSIIIYGNISLLYPRLYEKGHIIWYVLATIVLVVGASSARALAGIALYNRYFGTTPETFSLKTLLYVTATGIIIYILSFVYRIAIAYFGLKQLTEEMMEQKSLAELNLLKSQVQPHFLFNTLNNIYYEAYREAPRTALLIGRLSDIMRYFVDESPKESVSLSTEIKFLENYIALEEIRIRHGVRVVFHQEYSGNPLLPPMLLMPFVENIFKHGIDRSATDNSIQLSLVETDGYLLFRTDNALPLEPNANAGAGSGLQNLQRRLTLLYKDRYQLSTIRTPSSFQALLKIPLA